MWIEGRSNKDNTCFSSFLIKQYFVFLERGSTQLVVAQVFHAGREREGRRVDRRRQRVLPETSGQRQFGLSFGVTHHDTSNPVFD